MYSARDIETLRHVTQLSASGIGLEGVKRILALEAEISSLREQVARLEAQLRAARLSPENEERRPARPRPMAPPYQMERLPERSTAVVLWSRAGRTSTTTGSGATGRTGNARGRSERSRTTKGRAKGTASSGGAATASGGPAGPA